MNDTYLYPYSSAEARERNELSLWRESHKANIACRNAIEDAIRQNFDGMNLQTDCLKAVLDEYGYTGEEPAKDEVIKPAPQPEPTVPANDADVDAMKQDIVDRTNAIRREQGISALTVNAKLMQAAQVRADEMAASGVYSHTRPDGRKSNTVTDSKYTGENIHSISELYLEQQQKTLSEAVVNLWSNSKAHADNMTSSRYGEIGIGLARGVNQNGLDCWYCVQVFLLDGCEVTWVDTPVCK